MVGSAYDIPGKKGVFLGRLACIAESLSKKLEEEYFSFLKLIVFDF